MIRFCSLYCKISIPLTSRGTPTSNFQDLDLRPGIHRQTYKHSEQRVMKGVTKSQFPVHSYLHLDWRKSLIFLVSSLCLTALVGKVLVRLTLSSFAATVIVTFIGAGENLRRLFTGTELCARGSTSYKSNWLGNVYFFFTNSESQLCLWCCLVVHFDALHTHTSLIVLPTLLFLLHHF